MGNARACKCEGLSRLLNRLVRTLTACSLQSTMRTAAFPYLSVTRWVPVATFQIPSRRRRVPAATLPILLWRRRVPAAPLLPLLLRRRRVPATPLPYPFQRWQVLPVAASPILLWRRRVPAAPKRQPTKTGACRMCCDFAENSAAWGWLPIMCIVKRLLVLLVLQSGTSSRHSLYEVANSPNASLEDSKMQRTEIFA